MDAPMTRRERREEAEGHPHRIRVGAVLAGAAIAATVGVTAAYAAPAPEKPVEGVGLTMPVNVNAPRHVVIPADVWESKCAQLAADYQVWAELQEQRAAERAAEEARKAEELAAKKAAEKAAEEAAAAKRAAAAKAAKAEESTKHECDGKHDGDKDGDWRHKDGDWGDWGDHDGAGN
jgi:hypothetical protein